MTGAELLGEGLCAMLDLPPTNRRQQEGTVFDMPGTELRDPKAISTYEAGYYYASSDVTPVPGSVPAEEVLLTLTGTWPGNLANMMERMLAEVDTITEDTYAFRRETGIRCRREVDTLNEGVEMMIKAGRDLVVGESYAIVMRQDVADSDTEVIVAYVLRTA